MRSYFYSVINILGIVTAEPIKSLLADPRYCGYQHTDDYTRGDENIAIDEFPWMVQLFSNDSLICSGTLINNRYVLTAAQCFHSYKNITKVRLGDYNTNTSVDCTQHPIYGEDCNDLVEEFQIEEMIGHPAFVMGQGRYDIGLVRFSKNVQYSEYIRPICLQRNETNELRNREELVTSGWGTTHSGRSTKLKKKILTYFIPNNECKKLLNHPEQVTDDSMCGSEKDYSTIICSGDAGGPLMSSNKLQWSQVGILSRGKGCAQKYPSIYTKVSVYYDWIESQLRL